MADTTDIRLPKFEKKDIRNIVGPSSTACEKNSHLRKLPSIRKNVIAASWRSYKLYKEKENLEDEDPKTPYIKLESDEEGVYAQITSESPVMTKFVKFHLNKYQDEFVAPKKKLVYTFYAVLPHANIPQLIGRGGSSIDSVRSEAISQMDDEEMSPEEIAECEKTYTKVDKFTPRDFTDFAGMVNDSDRHKFIGWTPSEEEELVKIFISSHADIDVFNEFVECLHDSFQTRINEINEYSKRFSSSKEDELKEVMTALNAEW